MSTRTTNEAYHRSYGGRRKGQVTPGSAVYTMTVSGDPTETDETSEAAKARVGLSATEGPYAILPKGAVILAIKNFGGATGGTSPTVDIGSAASPQGFANEFVADSLTQTFTTVNATLHEDGNDKPIGLADDTQITVIQGASAATGGVWTGMFVYTMIDNGEPAEA